MGSVRKPRVLVMMATYNGEEFLECQIDSILAQEGVDVTLTICDDGSTDLTESICMCYAQGSENVSYKRNRANKRVARNFMDMLFDASDEYDFYAFSDQDDYWMPDKMVAAISLLEGYGKEPCLYYSDVLDVDENLEGGFLEYEAFRKTERSLETLLMFNWACGCTMMMNGAMRELVTSYCPKTYPRIHDAWVHMIALSCATTIPDLGVSHIKRRLSGKNVAGYRGQDVHSIAKVIKLAFNPPNHMCCESAELLLEGFGDRMKEDVRGTVERFARMPHSPISRIVVFLSPRFVMPGLKATLQQKVRLLANRL